MSAFIIGLMSFLLAVSFVFFPFRARFQGHIDVVANKCFYSIKLIFWRVIVGRCELNLPQGLDIQNQVNNLSNDPKHPHINQLYISGIIKRFKVSKFDFYFVFGDAADAFVTAMVCSCAQTFAACAISATLNNNKYAQVLSSVTPLFNQNACEMSIQMSIQVSFATLFKAKSQAKKLYKKLYL